MDQNRYGAMVLTAVGSACVLAPIPTAHAQWTVINLHPEGATGSHAFGVSEGQQVGSVSVANVTHGGYWSGSASTWTDFGPNADVEGVFRGQQVGSIMSGPTGRACIWNGTIASQTSLHPPSVEESRAFAVSCGRQVGWVRLASGNVHASLWYGNSQSWIDLNPSAQVSSVATSVFGNWQGGVAGGRACIWNGSASSRIDLHPAIASNSAIVAMSRDQQAGWVTIDGVNHASVWHPAWNDLNPPAASQSLALGAFGHRQVGWAILDDQHHASIWAGSAATWIDLHAYLPSDFSWSIAQGVWSDSHFIYVAGYGRNGATGREEALLWKWTNPLAIGCQPADIADDQGTALIDSLRNPSVPNTGVNEGDYNAFFQGFFDAIPYSDIADDAGNAPPVPCEPNSGVNEGDYNCFFQYFFNGCP